MDEFVIERVIKEMQALPVSMQRQVLQFAEMLRAATPQGVPGQRLLAFANTIPADELQFMIDALEQ